MGDPQRMAGMSPETAQKAFVGIGIIWVGGGGYLMFRYPEFISKLSFRSRSTNPGRIRFTRWLGIFEMVVAVLGAICTSVSAALGKKWY